MHLALQGDISRVFTFMIGHEPTDRSYAHIGVPETHHSISHHGNDAREARQVREDRHLSDGEVRRVPREGEGHQGRRRQPARPLAALLGQRHEQRQPARPQQPADAARGRRATAGSRATATSWPTKSRRRTSCSRSATSPASRSRSSAPARAVWICRSCCRGGRLSRPDQRAAARPPFAFPPYPPYRAKRGPHPPYFSSLCARLWRR